MTAHGFCCLCIVTLPCALLDSCLLSCFSTTQCFCFASLASCIFFLNVGAQLEIERLSCFRAIQLGVACTTQLCDPFMGRQCQVKQSQANHQQAKRQSCVISAMYSAVPSCSQVFVCALIYFDVCFVLTIVFYQALAQDNVFIVFGIIGFVYFITVAPCSLFIHNVHIVGKKLTVEGWKANYI